MDMRSIGSKLELLWPDKNKLLTFMLAELLSQLTLPTSQNFEPHGYKCYSRRIREEYERRIQEIITSAASLEECKEKISKFNL